MKNCLIVSGRKGILHISSNPKLKELIKVVYLFKSQEFLIEHCKSNNIPFEIKPKSFFDKNYGEKSKYKYKYAIALINKKPELSIKELISYTSKNKSSVLVMLDHLQDPFNLGAILRTCAAAGVDGVIIPKDNQAPVNHDATLKASQGYALNMNISSVSNLHQTLNLLKKEGYWIYTTDISDTSKHFKKIKYDNKVVLIIGTEGDGVSNLLKKSSDHHIYIPMKEGVDSLNVSVATGIILFEIVNQIF